MMNVGAWVSKLSELDLLELNNLCTSLDGVCETMPENMEFGVYCLVTHICRDALARKTEKQSGETKKCNGTCSCHEEHPEILCFDCRHFRNLTEETPNLPFLEAASWYLPNNCEKGLLGLFTKCPMFESKEGGEE